jgi:hypothetical protein
MVLPVGNSCKECQAMFKNKNIKPALSYLFRGLPLAAIIYASFLPMQLAGRQMLIAAALVWFQVFIIFEVFSIGK